MCICLSTANVASNDQIRRLIEAVVNAAPVHTDIHVQINAGGGSPTNSPPMSAPTTTSGDNDSANRNRYEM